MQGDNKNRKTKQDRQNTQERTAGKKKDQVCLQEPPHVQDSIQNHLDTPKAEIPKRKFSY
jgi:hypothetical protein